MSLYIKNVVVLRLGDIPPLNPAATLRRQQVCGVYKGEYNGVDLQTLTTARVLTGVAANCVIQFKDVDINMAVQVFSSTDWPRNGHCSRPLRKKGECTHFEVERANVPTQPHERRSGDCEML